MKCTVKGGGSAVPMVRPFSLVLNPIIGPLSQIQPVILPSVISRVYAADLPKTERLFFSST